jgi:hypothetical protein
MKHSKRVCPPGSWGVRGHAPRKFVLALLLVLGACGGSSPSDVATPDPAVAPFVGDWDATEFEVTSLADTSIFFDLIEATGLFTLNVQPSGAYTATLFIPDEMPQPAVENGTMSVIGDAVRLSPNQGPSATSAYEFEGPDRLILDGPTEFDFNFDGTFEPATLHVVLERS